VRLLWVACFTLQLVWPCLAAEPPSAAGVSEALVHMSPDPEQTFRVRDLQFVRGDIKIYLTEGVLSFLTPVCGKTIGAIFSTESVEAGDAEILVLPPQRNERVSLSSFIKSPNLDEHFDSTLFLFSDETAHELLTAIQQKPVHHLPEIGRQMTPSVHNLVGSIGADMRGQLVAALLDMHQPDQGFFYALVGGRTLGIFDVLYNPVEFEQVTIGRGDRSASAGSPFQLWTSFRPRHGPVYSPPAAAISGYRIETEIRPDLKLSASAAFQFRASKVNGRIIPLQIAEKLKIDSARVDGESAEIFQPSMGRVSTPNGASHFYVITQTPMAAGSAHEVEIHYEGSVIRKAEGGSYFVDDRNAWYPFTHPTLATFDLTFHCPENLRLVSTGELISDESKGGIRTVHRATRVPESLAGFNLGDYDVASEDHGAYRIECYSNKVAGQALTDIPLQMNALLDYYTRRWIQLPIHTVAVAPIPAQFGQGFPGLIYLSETAYSRAEDRPLNLRSAAYDQFFSDLLLPHEVAHQWWGNIVTSVDYRSAWINEAFANYSALQFVEKNHGHEAVDAILNGYRSELLRNRDDKAVESYGPLEFGPRLIDAGRADVWHAVVYEKGTWVMHMLAQRLGDEGFLKMQLRLLHDFADRPLTNEEFRKVAADFVPTGQADKNLSSFFDTWIYGTGIPKLEIKGQDITVSAVDDDFTADLPLHCRAKGGPDRMRWVRVSSGTNSLEFPAGTACELPSPNEFLYVPAH
jgi:Peptidase family M1 domain